MQFTRHIFHVHFPNAVLKFAALRCDEIYSLILLPITRLLVFSVSWWTLSTIVWLVLVLLVVVLVLLGVSDQVKNRCCCGQSKSLNLCLNVRQKLSLLGRFLGWASCERELNLPHLCTFLEKVMPVIPTSNQLKMFSQRRVKCEYFQTCW